MRELDDAIMETTAAILDGGYTNETLNDLISERILPVVTRLLAEKDEEIASYQLKILTALTMLKDRDGEIRGLQAKLDLALTQVADLKTRLDAPMQTGTSASGPLDQHDVDEFYREKEKP